MVMGCLLVSSNAQTTYYVAATDEIFTTVIQDAIDVAKDGDAIVVDPGIYYEGNIDLKGRAVTIQSKYPSNPAATTIYCMDFFSGFIFGSGETASTIIDGFTVIHASFEFGGAFVCTFDDEKTKRGGSPTIRNCVITNNNAESDGAGLYSDRECNPVVENCIFMINTSGKTGGAVSVSGGNPVYSNCQFMQNSSGESGGAVSIFDGNPLFTNCQFVQNVSGMSGGAISIDKGNPVFSNCLFLKNSTLLWGGAVYAYHGSPVFQNCVFAGNYADVGGVFWFDTTEQPQILGCTLIDNMAGSFVSGVCANSSQGLTIENSIFWGNVVPSKLDFNTIEITGQIEGTRARIAYCDIQDYLTTLYYESSDYTTVEGLMSLNPKFIQDIAGEYIPDNWHLQKSSPCINAGNPNYATVPGEVDIDGEDRVMNGRIEIGVDEVEVGIVAKVDIVPGKLIVPSKGFVLAMIRLPQGYAVKDINAKKILWNNKLAARCVEKCRYNAVAVFDLDKVSDLLGDVEGKVVVTISGQLANGMAFAGSDTIQVNHIHWKNWFKRVCHFACMNRSICKNPSACKK